MAPMTSRERYTAALRRQPVDRLPWMVDLAYYNAAQRAQGKLAGQYEGPDGFLRQHEELGADPYLFYGAGSYRLLLGETVSETRREGNDSITTWRLGGRTLTAVNRYMPESFCWAPVKHPVETVEEMELLLKIMRGARYEARIERHREIQALWGERGLLWFGVPRSPVPALYTEWCGMMAISMLSADAPDLFADVLAAFEAAADPVFDAVCQYKPVVVHFTDNISGENVGSFWDRYMAPLYRRRLKQLHEAGVLAVIHNDGTVRGILGRIAAVGFDGAEALTPAPVGDVAPADLRLEAGRADFILWGMIPGLAFTALWSEKQFRDHVQTVLRDVTGPIILGSADQLPPDADIRRVRLVHGMSNSP